MSEPVRNKLFISYSHADKEWLDRLEGALAGSDYEITLWSDRAIRPADEWEAEINKALSQTAVAVLLVSRQFFRSQFIRDKELPPLLAAAENREIKLTWIPLERTQIGRNELSRYQALHDASEPLSSVPEEDLDDVLFHIGDRILDLLAETVPDDQNDDVVQEQQIEQEQDNQQQPECALSTQPLLEVTELRKDNLPPESESFFAIRVPGDQWEKHQDRLRDSVSFSSNQTRQIQSDLNLDNPIEVLFLIRRYREALKRSRDELKQDLSIHTLRRALLAGLAVADSGNDHNGEALIQAATCLQPLKYSEELWSPWSGGDGCREAVVTLAETILSRLVKEHGSSQPLSDGLNAADFVCAEQESAEKLAELGGRLFQASHGTCSIAYGYKFAVLYGTDWHLRQSALELPPLENGHYFTPLFASAYLYRHDRGSEVIDSPPHQLEDRYDPYHQEAVDLIYRCAFRSIREGLKAKELAESYDSIEKALSLLAQCKHTFSDRDRDTFLSCLDVAVQEMKAAELHLHQVDKYQSLIEKIEQLFGQELVEGCNELRGQLFRHRARLHRERGDSKEVIRCFGRAEQFGVELSPEELVLLFAAWDARCRFSESQEERNTALQELHHTLTRLRALSAHNHRIPFLERRIQELEQAIILGDVDFEAARKELKENPSNYEARIQMVTALRPAATEIMQSSGPEGVVEFLDELTKEFPKCGELRGQLTKLISHWRSTRRFNSQQLDELSRLWFERQGVGATASLSTEPEVEQEGPEINDLDSAKEYYRSTRGTPARTKLIQQVCGEARKRMLNTGPESVLAFIAELTEEFPDCKELGRMPLKLCNDWTRDHAVPKEKLNRLYTLIFQNRVRGTTDTGTAASPSQDKSTEQNDSFDSALERFRQNPGNALGQASFLSSLQQHATDLMRTQGPTAAAKLITDLKKEFPTVRPIQGVIARLRSSWISEFTRERVQLFVTECARLSKEETEVQPGEAPNPPTPAPIDPKPVPKPKTPSQPVDHSVEELKVKGVFETYERHKHQASPASSEQPIVELSTSGTPRFSELFNERLKFFITAPASMKTGESSLLDVWAHLDHPAPELFELIKEELASRKELTAIVDETSTGPELSVRLWAGQATPPCSEVPMLWRDHVGTARFNLTPEEGAQSPLKAFATVHLGGFQVLRLDFNLSVGEAGNHHELVSYERSNRSRSAYISHVPEDKDTIVKMIEQARVCAPDLRAFTDVEELRNHGNFISQMRLEILRCGVFFLVWSKQAKDTGWIECECNCALEELGPEAVIPIPLENPEEVRPPQKLLDDIPMPIWIKAYESVRRSRSKQE